MRARVGDFGLAKTVNPLTLLASAAGTLAFKPPEAFTRRKGDSFAGDVWAIGATLYLLLTDRLPFDLPSDAAWGTKRLFDKPVIPPSQVHPDATAALDDIVLRTLAKRPEDRYTTATDLLDTLEQWKPAPTPPAPNGVALAARHRKRCWGCQRPRTRSRREAS